MRPQRRSISNEEFRTWALVFALACCFVTAYFCITNTLIAQSGTLLQWSIGVGFCGIPLVIAGLPLVLMLTFFRPQTQARRRASRGDLPGALQAYQMQLEILNRFPWLEAFRGYIFGDQRPGLREAVLLSMAHIAYQQNDYQQATNYLWRCLHYNPHNREAQVLLDVIRNLPHDGIRGW